MGKLTDRAVRNLGPGKHEDGEGLRLTVSPTGSRCWVLRYQRNNRRREMSLGPYPTVGLAEARELAGKARRQLFEGVDPLEARHQAPEHVPTFTQAAATYIRAHRRGWKNRKHGRQWCATLKTYARPVIGSKPVRDVCTEDVLKVLKAIWTTKPETAKRLQGRIENVLDFAAARQWRPSENPARWRGHLDKLLARPSKVRRVAHHPAMPYAVVPAFLVELRSREGIPARALELKILTACRTAEVLGATWGEIDLDASTWTIPAARTKTGREHRVPLSEPALALLAKLPRLASNPHCFPGTRYGRPLSSAALLQVLRAMGYGPQGERGPYVAHGFRSSFRDWAGEVSSFPRDVAEMALAHVIPNKAEAAYRRGDLFDKRRAMMDAWAAYLEAKPANVTRIRGEVRAS